MNYLAGIDWADMETYLYISFVATSTAVIIVPGPNVMAVVSTSLSYGSKKGLQTVLGTSTAMLIQLFIAAFSTTWLVDTLTKGFEWLRWLGVFYLVYLGITHLLRLLDKRDSKKETFVTSSFSRGFIVSLANPKTILFFSAYMPQFVSPRGEFETQITLLSATFLFLAMVFDSLYAILAGRLQGLLQIAKTHRIRDGISALLYICAGAWLAALRKT